MRAPKRGDLMVEEIKRWIAERRLAPGDRLPKEDELQTLFGVSKGTAREALKSLEVQGLVTVSTGPAGGATIGEVPLERAFQLGVLLRFRADWLGRTNHPAYLLWGGYIRPGTGR